QIDPHRLIERTACAPAHSVEDGAVDLGRTEARDQRVETARGPRRDLLFVMRGKMAERGARSRRTRIGVGGKHERKTQLFEIFLVGKREIFVEPLGRKQFRRRSPMRVTVGKFDTRAHEYLRRRGERHHAKPKGQAQPYLPFVEAHFSNGEYGRRHVSDSGWPRETMRAERRPAQPRQPLKLVIIWPVLYSRRQTVVKFRSDHPAAVVCGPLTG